MTIVTVQDTIWLNRTLHAPKPPVAPWLDDTANEPTPLMPALDIDAIFTEMTELLAEPSIVEADAETYGRHAYIEPELDSLAALAKTQAYNLLQLGRFNISRVPQMPGTPAQAEFWPKLPVILSQDASGVWTAPTGSQRLAIESPVAVAAEHLTGTFEAVGITEAPTGALRDDNVFLRACECVADWCRDRFTRHGRAGVSA